MVWILGFQFYLLGSIVDGVQEMIILVGTVMVLATFGFVAWTIRLVVNEIRDQKQASKKAQNAEAAQAIGNAPRPSTELIIRGGSDTGDNCFSSSSHTNQKT